ncbi:MAG: hypothetical protein J5871_05865 [Bacteroidales bacterium]|nr:hypothetical protein [Bacteroidales bacterium]
MKLFRKILRGLSLTSVLFIFQACYGAPQVNPDFYENEETKTLQCPDDAEDGGQAPAGPEGSAE